MYQELERDNLSEFLNAHPKTIVQYGASWCGSCKIMKPKFKKSEAEHNDISYLYVDAELFPESRKYANVNNLPTFAAFHHEQLHSQVQTNKADVFFEFVNQFLK
ncbi:MAG: thioredoxin family protein [Chitinophagaceae bacterium]